MRIHNTSERLHELAGVMIPPGEIVEVPTGLPDAKAPHRWTEASIRAYPSFGPDRELREVQAAEGPTPEAMALPKALQTLAEVPEAEAIRLISAEKNPDVLKAWARTEKRPAVIGAIASLIRV